MGLKRTVRTYVILGKDRYNQPSIRGTRSTKPNLKSGEIAVRIVLTIDDTLFDQVIPTITAEIVASDIIEPTVTVEPAPDEEEE